MKFYSYEYVRAAKKTILRYEYLSIRCEYFHARKNTILGDEYLSLSWVHLNTISFPILSKNINVSSIALPTLLQKAGRVRRNLYQGTLNRKGQRTPAQNRVYTKAENRDERWLSPHFTPYSATSRFFVLQYPTRQQIQIVKIIVPPIPMRQQNLKRENRRGLASAVPTQFSQIKYMPSHTLSYTLSLTHSFTLTFIYFHTDSHNLSHIHTHTYTRAHTHTPNLTHTDSHSHTLSHHHALFQTDTLLHSFSHTLPLSHTASAV